MPRVFLVRGRGMGKPRSSKVIGERGHSGRPLRDQPLRCDTIFSPAGGWRGVGFRREDRFPQALALFDVKSRVRLAIFLQGAINGLKRGVEVRWLIIVIV